MVFTENLISMIPKQRLYLKKNRIVLINELAASTHHSERHVTYFRHFILGEAQCDRQQVFADLCRRVHINQRRQLSAKTMSYQD